MKNNIIFPVNLTRYLSLTGIASRRKCIEIVRKGEITINDIIIEEPSKKVNKNDIVKYKNTKVEVEEKYYIILNKPPGYTCSNSDIHADKLVLDLIDLKEIRLFTAGRLDRDSEGLIIVTNDGDYANKLMHPSNEIEKVYEVEINKDFELNDINAMLKGIYDEGEKLKALKVEKKQKNIYLFTLSEGKKREVRRLVKYAKRKTVSLKRIRLGKLSINNLPTGQWKHLTKEDVQLTLCK